jgi:integrase
MRSYDVKFWAIRPGKAATRRTYEVRWKVGHKPHSRTLRTKALAESFLSELRQAARAGQPFDGDSGLPGSMATANNSRSWLAFCLAYIDMKWPSAAPKTRDSLTDALAAIIPAVVADDLPDWLDIAQLRAALRHYALAPASRAVERPPEVASALRWLEKNSLPVTELGKPACARSVLEAISLRQDGRVAGATTIARKRSVFANVLRYAVELEELPADPLTRLNWKPPKISDTVDRRVVVNPRQARELLTAVTYVGQRGSGERSRGQRLMALYACMYFAALRPGEAVALRERNCYLPETGWGRLTLENSRPEVNRRWTDSASAHEERGLKHRPAQAIRRVPIPPELVRILSAHIASFGVTGDGRIFSSERSHVVASTAISDVWAEARTLAMTPEQVASPLASRPYDLRHAAVSLWLNAGVPAPDVAERAGHSVEVLLRVYAKCLDEGQDLANARIEAALHLGR